MSHTVTLIPGDSLGQELAPVMRRVVAATGVSITWELAQAGHSAFQTTGDPLPPDTLDSIRRNRVALKGRILTPEKTGYKSPNVRLHRELDLFAVLRPLRNLPGLESRFDGVDVVLIREGTEDVYAGIEHEVVPGVIQSLKVTTREACLRICCFAFHWARTNGRSRVTLVHKANIMKKADGLFMRCGQEVAEGYPDIRFDTIIADNACMQMVRDPRQFDVMVSQNLFGDILADLGAGIVGGIGAVWGELGGTEDLRVFEVLHGVAPDLEGKGVANPLPFLLPARALLEHLGETEAATRLGRAMSTTLSDGIRTKDLGGTASTADFEKAVIERLG